MNILEKPPINEGEAHIAALTDAKGELYHLILLDGDNDPATHADQVEWAKSIGGELPNKVEAAILFAYAKDKFKNNIYWTGETFVDPDEPEDSSYAWVQHFRHGDQGSLHESYKFRARAVRRLPI